MPLEIAVFPARSDNFGYLVRDVASGRVASIDAPDAGAIIAELEKRGWVLTDLLITHHHADHTDGIGPLKAAYGAHAIGPKGDAGKIEGLDTLVDGGDAVMLGETRFAVIGVPGHTLGHIAFHAPADKVLFSADALFSLGVGRMFEGDYETMWAGLKRLKALDPQTLVYCGHEYTLANARFALSIDPDNPSLKARADEARRQIDRGEATIPARLADELAANPFLRADDLGMARRMGLEGAPASQVFGALRKAKDSF
ncbi:hydroxyacylglutathione hydrolase [Pelagibacterium lacus]|uniref:Hydroxyacylglutathione hydrolase n=1 Tax=Pelagibacterium lacus TaxID=2282655 RepID=A0A369W6C7_9HYPH|nr:hydroxyacylglutathione hydrolase [Pelagibacterium lacus]RDE08812.1 hydroxyacylglutathione hydrolase [Pelagibacterium lacus]